MPGPTSSVVVAAAAVLNGPPAARTSVRPVTQPGAVRVEALPFQTAFASGPVYGTTVLQPRGDGDGGDTDFHLVYAGAYYAGQRAPGRFRIDGGARWVGRDLVFAGHFEITAPFGGALRGSARYLWSSSRRAGLCWVVAIQEGTGWFRGVSGTIDFAFDLPSHPRTVGVAHSFTGELRASLVR